MVHDTSVVVKLIWHVYDALLLALDAESHYSVRHFDF